jgi:hypothetical protein
MLLPVLLMAQGEPGAKDLLRKAIQARYGLRPPVLESLDIRFKGRARTKIGPLSTWVPVEARGRFSFPDAMRWDFTITAVGVQLGSGVEAFDGQTYRVTRGQKDSWAISDEHTARSMQLRLWSIAAVLLTPLGEPFIRLEPGPDHSLFAQNTRFNGVVSLCLRPDHSLAQVDVTCLNPDTGQSQVFTLQLSHELQVCNDLILPANVKAFWDDEPYFELEPLQVEANPSISPDVFTLNETTDS